MERERGGVKFDHWVFIDEDIHLNCGDSFGELACWNVMMDFVANGMPQNAVAVGPADAIGDALNYYSFTTFDAMLTVFRRRYVPYLLPYPVPGEGESQWHSQAVLFHLFTICFPRAAVSPPVRIANLEHRDYVRGLNPAEVIRLAHDSYDAYAKLDYEDGLAVPGFYDQNKNHQGFTNELNLAKFGVPSLNYTLCEPLAGRYADWESRMTLGTALGATSDENTNTTKNPT